MRAVAAETLAARAVQQVVLMVPASLPEASVPSADPVQARPARLASVAQPMSVALMPAGRELPWVAALPT